MILLSDNLCFYIVNSNEMQRNMFCVFISEEKAWKQLLIFQAYVQKYNK